MAGERARGRVGDAQVDRQHERRADEQADEEDGRSDEERARGSGAARGGRACAAGDLAATAAIAAGIINGADSVTGVFRALRTLAAAWPRSRSRRLTKVYPGRDAGGRTTLDLEIADGELVVFVGPSGCGKTTALRMIAGLEEITDGHVRIGDQVVNDLPPKDRDIAMVFQNYALYPHMTAYDNMAFGLKLRKIDRAEIGRRVSERPGARARGRARASSRARSRAGSGSAWRWAARSCASRRRS